MKKTRVLKKLTALALSIVLIVGLMPVSAFAEETKGQGIYLGAGELSLEELKTAELDIDYPPNPKSIGDNMVGFLSQIGWTKDDSNTPNKKISFERIFIDIDADGGNDVFDRLHSKIPRRLCVVQKVCSYLNE